MMELIKTIRARLIADPTVSSLVPANDIRVHNMPLDTSTKQILLQETLGRSEITLDADLGIFTILVYVKDSIDEPYEELKEITQAILSVLDRKNETLKDSNSFVRFFVKTSGDFVHNNDERYWMCEMVFDYVTGE